ncbi:MAG: HK97 family phage prohead protease [Hyphomonadaceae bacterium]|nr:HK97 family phage prohead protease [Hyphomonadaceae bacterium]
MIDHNAWPVEGYAALFGVADLEGDVVRAGAFRDSLARASAIPMLVRHDPRLVAGVWSVFEEDARGLHVQGRILRSAPAGGLAMRLVQRGVDGLSIGFRTRAARPLTQGRELVAIDLIEVSIVPTPMAPRARFARVSTDGARFARINPTERTMT